MGQEALETFGGQVTTWACGHWAKSLQPWSAASPRSWSGRGRPRRPPDCPGEGSSTSAQGLWWRQSAPVALGHLPCSPSLWEGLVHVVKLPPAAPPWVPSENTRASSFLRCVP